MNEWRAMNEVDEEGARFMGMEVPCAGSIAWWMDGWVDSRSLKKWKNEEMHVETHIVTSTYRPVSNIRLWS